MVEKRDMVLSLGLEPHDTSGSRSVNSARFPVKSYQDRIVFGLEGSRKAGVSCVTCSNPQALFCALGTAQGRTEGNSNRRKA